MTDPSTQAARPVVTVDPRMNFGAPSVRGVEVGTIGELVWAGEPVGMVCANYDLTREQVLTACWFLGRFGIEDATPSMRHGAYWRARWGTWAWAADDAMWRGRWQDVTDPPTRNAPEGPVKAPRSAEHPGPVSRGHPEGGEAPQPEASR